MKRLMLIAVAALMVLACNNTQTAQCGRHGVIEAQSWFSIQDISPDSGSGEVFLINEHGHATAYLVTGSKAAMLIDTGVGVGDYSALAGSLTTLPLIVVNTHAHSDHVGANYQFSEVWLPEKDLELMQAMNPLKNPNLEASVASQAGDFEYDKQAAKANIAEILTYPEPKIKLFNEGKTWDLGGKVITALSLGGHTPGSMLFLDETDRYIFSGDAMNGYLWMWLDHCLSIEEYAQNLEAILPEFDRFDRIYGGHEVNPLGVEATHAAEMLADVKAVLAGEIAPVVTPSPMGGNGTVNVYHFDTWLLWAK